ncbi:hypothetical protein G9P44_004495 [Scheffersomyces stipitis]|nr:hypothetical protein G9P44_004495 [Scheffersomyces stipitis]
MSSFSRESSQEYDDNLDYRDENSFRFVNNKGDISTTRSSSPFISDPENQEDQAEELSDRIQDKLQINQQETVQHNLQDIVPDKQDLAQIQRSSQDIVKAQRSQDTYLVVEEDKGNLEDLPNLPNFQSLQNLQNHNKSQIGTENDNSFDNKEISPFQDNNHSNDSLGASIASFRESLASHELKSTRTAMQMRHENDTSFHNSTIDTTRYNDTRAQLDHDLNFDVSPQRLSTSNSNFTATLSHFSTKPTKTSPITPWRKLRTASTYTPTRDNGRPPSLPYASSTISGSNGKFGTRNVHNEVSTESKIDDLNKQVTSYRIQIQMLKQFLQKIIDRARELNQPGFDLEELQHIQNDLHGLSPAHSVKSSYRAEYDNLQQDYNEIFQLNQDLYANLESFQSQLHDKEIQLQASSQYIEDCSYTLDEILQTLIIDPATSLSSRQALLQCLKTKTSKIEVKLQVLKLELNTRLETNQTSYVSPPASDHGIQKPKEDTAFSVELIEQLTTTVNSLEDKFNKQKFETEKLEQDLFKEAEDSKAIKKNFQMISEKFSQLCRTIDENETDNNLREENARLLTQLEDHKSKLQQYQEQEKENNFSISMSKSSSKNSSSSSKNEDSLREELLELKRAYDALSEEFDELTNQQKKYKEDKENTITSLTNQLQRKQSEISAYRGEEKITEKLRLDLEIAVEKQRKLNAEKIKLSYAVDTLKSKEESLKSTIESLTQKVTELAVVNHGSDSTAAKRQFNVLEYQFSELLSFDLVEFQKLIKSFNKIADDASLKDPKKKFENLRKRVVEKEDSTPWENHEIDYIRDQHKSIFEYFARAIDILVNDHVRLLLRENDHQLKGAHKDAMNELQQRIRNLEMEKNTLYKQIETYEQELELDYDDSPISKLRMEDLRYKWKAERERRVIEDKEAQRRFRELEAENSRLREKLSSS